MVLDKIDPLALFSTQARVVLARRGDARQLDVDQGGQAHMGELDVDLLHHDVVEHVGRRRHVAPASGHQHHIFVVLPRAGEQPCPV
ncbi:hypothetical protein D3C85_1066360 [compost metagenome]